MAVKDKVCRMCRRFVEGSKCPICNMSSFSRSWKGIVVITDPNESEIAQLLNIKHPGKYCLWVK
ncbi:transcription elongation factor subunit Spt4 [Candidatus Aenigmatarchaeota archaeon]